MGGCKETQVEEKKTEIKIGGWERHVGGHAGVLKRGGGK